MTTAAVPVRLPRVGSPGMRSALWTVLLVVVLAVVLELGPRLGLWPAEQFPPTSIVLARLAELAGTAQFWSDLALTFGIILASAAIGCTLGLLLGIALWRYTVLGKVLQPYLIAGYAVPLVLLYPVLIVAVGINAWSVIIIGSVMALIPMALNTGVGLSTIRSVYPRLAQTLGCNPWQSFSKVLLPAAAPMVSAGVRLATAYALIGCISMEFVTAPAGLGYRIRYFYEGFNDVSMYAYIVVILIFSVLVTTALAVGDRLVTRGRR